jgi:flagellar assembly protein FliH
MTSTSPEPGAVLRGQHAGTASTARFDFDLRGGRGLPADVWEELRAQAHAAGYAAGWAQGCRAAEAAANAARDQEQARTRQAAEGFIGNTSHALAALANAATSLERRVVPAAADVEDAIVTAAFALAQAIVGRELAVAKVPGEAALARVLALAPAGRPVTVRLNPSDHAFLAAAGAATEVAGRTVTLVADPGVRAGDALAECDSTNIDGRIATAVERVREVLGQ